MFRLRCAVDEFGGIHESVIEYVTGRLTAIDNDDLIWVELDQS